MVTVVCRWPDAGSGWRARPQHPSTLSRFYDIAAGTITFDGRDIRAMRQASIRKQLGIVRQDSYLSSSTVIGNTRYGRLGASDDQVYAAPKLANADWFIRPLPYS